MIKKIIFFLIKEEFGIYNQLQDKIEKCDQEILTILDETINNGNNKKQYYIDQKVHKKNQQKTLGRSRLKRSMKNPMIKCFASWLCLAPSKKNMER
ncbi:hypothetical protein ACHRVK_21890 [Flavobacterium plurextorum]|uniref:Uncharacterized protein n=1 Tax=Flavobacterium oncorhynchi TaxID=728056 RepID=A0A226HY88_9FLAO|nr:hypothetical protein [Flavobacterium oncorhynchi]OXA99165.1 hypothetical protein B0A75_12140 [Flavobacterium oncorhynchi]